MRFLFEFKISALSAQFSAITDDFSVWLQKLLNWWLYALNALFDWDTTMFTNYYGIG